MAFSYFFRIFCDFLKEGKVKKEKARRAAENREQGLTDLPFCGKIMRARERAMLLIIRKRSAETERCDPYWFVFSSR